MGRVEIFQGRVRRRWSDEDKRRLVLKTFGRGETVHGVARRHGISTSQLFTWRKRFRAEVGFPISALPLVPAFAAVEIAPWAAAPTGAKEAPVLTGLIEIELRGGERVRISGAADPTVVTAALRTLVQR
jgi:transposase